MAKQSSVNLDITNNPDGFDISGGTTLRKLSVTGGDVTIAGSGSATVTFPTTSTTIAGLGISQTFTALQSFSAGISAAGGITFASRIQGVGATFTGIVEIDTGLILPNSQNITSAVTTFNGASGAVSFAVPLASSSATGVASFGNEFVVTSGAVGLTSNYVKSVNGRTGNVGLPLASSSATGVASFGNEFTVSAAGAVGLTSNYVKSVNGLTGAVVSIATTGSNVFTGLNTFNAGISAAGGVTFSGDIAVNGGDITTTSATATVFNTTATTLSIGSAATTLTMGATSGIAKIRNSTLTLGNTVATIDTNDTDGNYINIAPYGSVILAPNSQSFGDGTRTTLVVTNGQDGTGEVQISGGNLYIGNRNDGFADQTGSIIFEGSTDNANDTTLTVVNPTATRTISLPDASGTVALTNSVVTSFNGATGAVTGITAGGANTFTALNSFNAGISAGGTTAATFNGTVNCNSSTVYNPTLQYYNEPYATPSITGNVLTLDLRTAQVFGVTLNSPISTFTISNTPATANRSIGFTLILTADGTARGITWGSPVKWSGGVTPTTTITNGKKDIFTFMTINGGTEWLGFIAGQNF